MGLDMGVIFKDESESRLDPKSSRKRAAAGGALLCLIWTCIVGLLVIYRAPIPLPLVFGAIVGHAAYYDLKLRARDGKEWTLAKNLNHKPEADWPARQIAAATVRFSVKDIIA
ncbi:MAG TPA: hypothetical protein VGJ73_05000 [Verrucomicrobiae bacterium]|jgi:hypothetical protein